MARIRIPKGAGKFEVIIARAGNYVVWNKKTGGGKIIIPCRDKEQAETLCRRLNSEKRDREIWI